MLDDQGLGDGVVVHDEILRFSLVFVSYPT